MFLFMQCYMYVSYATMLVVNRGEICFHLGYPIGVDASNVKLVDWASRQFEDKFKYYKSQMWPFHVRLKVVQPIMIPILSYYLPLLPWSKKIVWFLLSKKERKK